jgi:hypothetical protein
MQEYTNRYNLPEELYNALTKNRYIADDENGDMTTDYSISALVAPTRQTILKRRYPDCAARDCIENVWLLFGNMMHALLEEHGSDESITEKRFYKKILDKTISGQIDHYKNGIVTDYKTTSTYKYVKRSFDDWSAQLNSYAELCEEYGHKVDAIRIIAVFKDWKKRDLKTVKNYPPAEIVIIPLLKWSKDARERYMYNRVKALVDAESLADDQLPLCTEEEIWSRFTAFNVLKVGNKVGRNFETREEATRYLVGKNIADYVITRRTSPPLRCLEYCSASTKCSQLAAWKKENDYTE